MRISIIGTGRMARHLAPGWLKAGHVVQFGSRQPDSKADILHQIPGAALMSNVAALKAVEVVVIALPFTAVRPFAEEYAGLLRHKLVLDISNPFDNLPDNRISGPEITAQAIGEGARVVAAFKTNFWQILHEPVDPKTGLVRDVYYVGDSDDDKAVVAQLIQDLGFLPVDCGPLGNARILDGMVPLIVELDRRYANGERRFSWKLL
jgi:predicted dinucleotide-binding enzyme